MKKIWIGILLFSMTVIIGMGQVKGNTSKVSNQVALEIGDHQYDNRYIYLKAVSDEIVILDTQPKVHQIAKLGSGDALLLREPYLLVLEEEHGGTTKVRIYDVTDKAKPKEVRHIEIPGYLVEYKSRGNEVCIITATYDKKQSTLKDSVNGEVKMKAPMQVESGFNSIIAKINVENSAPVEATIVDSLWGGEYLWEGDDLIYGYETLGSFEVRRYHIFNQPITCTGIHNFTEEEMFNKTEYLFLGDFYMTCLGQYTIVGCRKDEDDGKETYNYILFSCDEKMQPISDIRIKTKKRDHIWFIGDKAYIVENKEKTHWIDLSNPYELKEIATPTNLQYQGALFDIGNDMQIGIETVYNQSWFSGEFESSVISYSPYSTQITLWATKEGKVKKLDEMTTELLTSAQYSPQTAAISEKYQYLALPAYNMEKSEGIVLKVEEGKLKIEAELPQIKTFDGMCFTTDSPYLFCIGEDLYYKYNNELSQYDLKTLKHKGNTIIE